MYGAWLGIQRNSSAGDAFYWIDGTPSADHFSAWAGGEPNNENEKCGHIYTASDKTGPAGKWNDNKCSFSGAKKNESSPSGPLSGKVHVVMRRPFWSLPSLKAKQEICLP